MKARRQAAILDLINEYPIETQEELLLMLRENGFNVTQATISRDIKELRLLKSLSADGKYRYTTLSFNNGDNQIARNEYFSNTILSVKAAQNIVVVKTAAGAAGAHCARIDAVERDGVEGTLAGDDTILIVCTDNESAAKNVVAIKQFFRL